MCTLANSEDPDDNVAFCQDLHCLLRQKPSSESYTVQGRIQDFWKGGHMYNGVGVHFSEFISFFLNIPRK